MWAFKSARGMLQIWVLGWCRTLRRWGGARYVQLASKLSLDTDTALKTVVQVPPKGTGVIVENIACIDYAVLRAQAVDGSGMLTVSIW